MMMNPRLLMSCWVLLPIWAMAQTAHPHSSELVKHTTTAMHAAKPLHAKSAPQPIARAMPSLPPLSERQRTLAQQVQVGRFPCEFGVFVNLQTEARAPGYFLAQHGKNTYWLAPVESATGAIRLEDAKTGVVWLQLTSKSMLMSEKLGRRLVDACMSPSQVLVTLALQKNPPPFILDGLPTQAAQNLQTPPALALGERQDDK
jgi:hypothetical protein